jgi:hypothetical protein
VTPARALCAALIFAVAGVGGAAWAQSVVGEVAPTTAGGSALGTLETAPEALSTQDAEALLERAYNDQFTPSERARAFAAAAAIASREGAHEQALAWIDWAVGETPQLRAQAPELADRIHADAIDVALAAGDPLQLRAYVRAYAGLEQGWTDAPSAAGVRVGPMDALCPDVIDDRFVRMRITRGAAPLGAPNARPTRCLYAPLDPHGSALRVELYATRVWTPARRRIRSIVDAGLDPTDAAARAAIAERLTMVRTAIESRPAARGKSAFGEVIYTRPGVDEVEAITYATLERDGVLLAARVQDNDRAWPPERLRAIADTALQTMTDDR